MLDTFYLVLVCDQVMEDTDFSTEVESQDQPVKTTQQDVQSKASESTESTVQLKISEADEPTNEPEEDIDQSTGPSLNDLLVL